MSFVSTMIGTAERVPLPDAIIRAAVHRLCSRTATRLASGNAESDAWFADEMAARAIAEYTDEANTQHYEVPAAFFANVLGPNRKYSSCFCKEPASTLQEAEEEALRQTVEHADLADGQTILELGCGWGSLSLWMARQFPHSRRPSSKIPVGHRNVPKYADVKAGFRNEVPPSSTRNRAFPAFFSSPLCHIGSPVRLFVTDDTRKCPQALLPAPKWKSN